MLCFFCFCGLFVWVFFCWGVVSGVWWVGGWFGVVVGGALGGAAGGPGGCGLGWGLGLFKIDHFRQYYRVEIQSCLGHPSVSFSAF